MPKQNKTRIGNLANYYGGIWVSKGEGEEIGRYFLGLEGCEGVVWEEISLMLYHHLLKHNKTLK